MIIIFYQDMPIGLMDDIYDFISKFAERLDDLEEVILQQIQQFHLLTFEANVQKSASETLNKYTFQILQYISWTQNISLVEYCWMKLNNMLILSFQGNQSFSHITLKNYLFMYTASNFLKS